MKDLMTFLKSKRFITHFIISIIFGVLVFWSSLKYLDIYTHHGEKISVPDFTNVKMDDLNAFIDGRMLKYKIIDSVYDTKTKPGVVLKQDPEKDFFVKQNRTIYLTVSSKRPPLIQMPNLVDASMRQALAVIQSNGLQLGKRSYRPDPCLNCVLEQSIKGKEVKPGKMIAKGTVIDLVLGGGQNGEKLNMPCLIGLNYEDAERKIIESGFSRGAVSCTECKTKNDREKAKVYQQNPPCTTGDTLLDPGSVIGLSLNIK